MPEEGKKCPLCGHENWTGSPTLHYLPKLDGVSGQLKPMSNQGIHVRVWRCDNCLYVMMFWEPDSQEPKKP